MYKKTITYDTFDDEPETIVEDFYFNISQAEALELNLSQYGGLEEQMRNILIKRDYPALAKFFKDLVLASYGVRTADRKGFKKSQELRDEFEQSDAYNKLMSELLMGDNDEALKFIVNVFPGDKNQKDAMLKGMKTGSVNKELKDYTKNDPALANALGIDEKVEPAEDAED